jgi:hypothetical protein
MVTKVPELKVYQKTEYIKAGRATVVIRIPRASLYRKDELTISNSPSRLVHVISPTVLHARLSVDAPPMSQVEMYLVLSIVCSGPRLRRKPGQMINSTTLAFS